jgi:hypothetical protein
VVRVGERIDFGTLLADARDEADAAEYTGPS